MFLPNTWQILSLLHEGLLKFGGVHSLAWQEKQTFVLPNEPDIHQMYSIWHTYRSLPSLTRGSGVSCQLCFYLPANQITVTIMPFLGRVQGCSWEVWSNFLTVLLYFTAFWLQKESRQSTTKSYRYVLKGAGITSSHLLLKEGSCQHCVKQFYFLNRQLEVQC